MRVDLEGSCHYANVLWQSSLFQECTYFHMETWFDIKPINFDSFGQTDGSVLFLIRQYFCNSQSEVN